MNNLLKELEKILDINRIKKNEPMCLHTTFKIGGPAQIYIEVEKTEELVKIINLAKKMNFPFLVLGGGSNLLVSDIGVKSLVIKNNCRRFEMLGVSGRVKNQKINMDKALVFAESGVITNQLVRFTIEQGLGGLEYFLGLPGTIGGAIFVNAHFPKEKKQIGDYVYKVKLLTKGGIIKEVNSSYLNFAYGQSFLQKSGEIILSIIFQMQAFDKKNLWDKATQVLEHRNKTQPKGASAGCIFKNISLSESLRVPTPQQITSAGYLIDKAGLKGKKIGDAVISDLHANYILNSGNATAKDVMSLINLIKKVVFEKFGINLVLEINTIGF